MLEFFKNIGKIKSILLNPWLLAVNIDIYIPGPGV